MDPLDTLDNLAKPDWDIPVSVDFGFFVERRDHRATKANAFESESKTPSLRDAVRDPTGASTVRILNQVHGTRVVKSLSDGLETADAHWSAEEGVCLVILTADCIPVLVGDLDGQFVAAAHCGWRGLAAGILPNLIETLPKKSHHLFAILGPAICGRCYEIGFELLQAFKLTAASKHVIYQSDINRYRLDLPGIAISQLKELGVENVHWVDRCTLHDHANLPSYRRNKTNDRLVSYIQKVRIR